MSVCVAGIGASGLGCSRNGPNEVTNFANSRTHKSRLAGGGGKRPLFAALCLQFGAPQGRQTFVICQIVTVVHSEENFKKWCKPFQLAAFQ